MVKLANQVLDFYDEISANRAKIETVISKLPEMVKKANIPATPDEINAIPDKEWALIVVTDGGSLRKYAIDSNANSYLSVLSFVKNADKLPKEAQSITAKNLLEAGDYFNLFKKEDIPSITRDALQKIAGDIGDGNIYIDENKYETEIQVKKEAEDYALRYKDKGIVTEKYPIDTEEGIKLAIEKFTHIGEPFKHKPIYIRQMAYRINKAAEDKNISIPKNSIISKYASDDYDPALNVAIEERQRACVKRENELLYSELYEKRAEFEPVVFAHILENVDRHTGVNKVWNRVGDPYYTTLGIPLEKDAAENIPGLEKNAISSDVGNILTKFSQSTDNIAKLHKYLPDVSEKFAKNPVKTYMDLPVNVQHAIIKLIG